MQIFRRLIKFARKPSREKREKIRTLARFYQKKALERWQDWDWRVPRLGNDRTAYLIGVFGTGLTYLERQLVDNIGVRARYIRYGIRLQTRPTSMIYWGHATLRYPFGPRCQPEVTSRIFEAVRARIADVIFVYRHPLDSFLTNWVWWQMFLRENRWVSGITEVYKSTDDFCDDLERNFADFKAFANADPGFSGFSRGPILSIRQFVEETELFLQSPVLPIRFEDFFIDPSKEFGKIARVMSVDLDLSRTQMRPPSTKPYRFLEVREKVPQFRDFIDGLDAETRSRIENLGYNLGG